MNAQDLGGKLLELNEQSTAIVDRAESEGRSITETERAKLKSLSAEFDRTKERAAIAERDDFLSKPLPRKTQPEQPTLGPFSGLHETSGTTGDGLARTTGSTWDAVDPKTGEKLLKVAPGESLSAALGVSRDGPTLERAIAAALRNDWSDARAERQALAVSGIEDTSGGFGVTPMMSATIFDAVRAAAPVFSQCTVIPMGAPEVTFLRVDTDPVASWTSEGVSNSETTPVFGLSTLKARTVRTYSTISQEALDDAPNVVDAIRRSLVGTFALAMDSAIISGQSDGDAASPVGLRVVAGTTEQSSVGTPADYDDFLTGIYNCELNNAPRPYHLIAHPRTYNTLAQLKTGITSDVTQLTPPVQWNELTRLSTTGISIAEGSAESYAIIGPLAECIVGLRMSLDITISRDFDSGAKFNRSIVAALRMDMIPQRASWFTKLTGITAT